jgi:hypothetical protein
MEDTQQEPGLELTALRELVDQLWALSAGAALGAGASERTAASAWEMALPISSMPIL